MRIRLCDAKATYQSYIADCSKSTECIREGDVACDYGNSTV